MTENFVFQEAERKQLKARIGLCGPAGGGKTYSALIFASVIAEAEGGRIAVIDTENGSAALYADEFSFLHLRLGPPYAPIRYAQAMEAAVAQGASVIVVDSLSHAWASEGGVLDIKDNASRRSGVNDFTAWRDATPEHERLVNALVYSPVHVIATMRSKVAYAMEQKDNGRMEVRKVGLQPVQREGMDFEFTMVADIDIENTLLVSKSRCKPLARAIVRNPDKNSAPTYDMARTFYGWLQQGAPASKFADWPWLDILVSEHGEGVVLDAVNKTLANWSPPQPEKASLLEVAAAPGEFQKVIYDLLSGHDPQPQDDDWSANGQADAAEDVGTGSPEDSTESEAEPKAEAPVDAVSPTQQELGGEGVAQPAADERPLPSENTRDHLRRLISGAVEANLTAGRAKLTETYVLRRYSTLATGAGIDKGDSFEDVLANGDLAILSKLTDDWKLQERIGELV